MNTTSLMVAAAEKEPAAPIRPFKIAVTEAMIGDLNNRHAKTRWSDAAPGEPWELGVPLAYMKELTEYWRTKYDWRKQERTLNAYRNSSGALMAWTSISCMSNRSTRMRCHCCWFTVDRDPSSSSPKSSAHSPSPSSTAANTADASSAIATATAPFKARARRRSATA